ncbi:hypothetical protein H1215_15595 [Anoxybacillus sp. LAT_38]|uniref:hypothetical protein n=1 Tax=Anoxybacillus sp. LAT_26 TaxID=2862719 RepID=UPI001EEB3AFC|nr:hypothetical protein [Anoxybacillus sp. LAT_26]MCG6184274.1 hypothetical protein [Anoxybacillus sp. LAT_26]MCG6198597.1 hypothetical protein [Anoxybacillus sp. LAT_38]
MTREEKKRLRMQIVQLLDECDTCEYKTKSGASVTVCRGCPIGKRLTELSGHFKKKMRGYGMSKKSDFSSKIMTK